MGRLEELLENIPETDVMADVGCDHGYLSKLVLEKDRCRKVYITDISAPSLKKAETLLAREIQEGRCVPVCCDGLSGVKEALDFVVIAGMGGEEIIHVLDGRALPSRFLLQPMKNAPKLRAYLLGRGAKIVRDYTFRDGFFYDVIVGEGSGQDAYSEDELLFGRDNLSSPTPAFKEKLCEERGKILSYLTPEMQPKNRAELQERLRRIEKVLYAIEKSL